MAKSISAGFRAFSAASKESSYGSAQTIDKLLYFNGQPSQVKLQNQYTNDDEINGVSEPNVHEVLSKISEFTHEQRAMPQNIALMLGACLGKVTTDQPDAGGNSGAYRHYLERDLTTLLPPTVSMVEDDNVQKKLYKGIGVKSFSLSGGRNEFIKMTAQCMGDGSESNSVVSAPSILAEDYFRWGDMNLYVGGSLSGTVALGTLARSGGTLFSAAVRSASWTVDNGMSPIYEIGNSLLTVGRMEYGKTWTHTLNVQFEMNDTTHHDLLIAGTPSVLHLPIIGGVILGGDASLNYRAELFFPVVEYIEVNKSYDSENKLIVDCSFQVLEDATLGSVICEVQNKDAAYLA